MLTFRYDDRSELVKEYHLLITILIVYRVETILKGQTRDVLLDHTAVRGVRSEEWVAWGLGREAN